MTILNRVLSENRARSVAVIPTASDYPGEMKERYARVFHKLGAEDIHLLDIRSPGEADKEEHIDAVRNADVTFFTGGDQVKLVRVLENTPVIQEIWKRFREGMTIAGTSAGAAAAGEIMIFSGDDEGCQKGAVRHSTGFGFVEGITFDTHFLIRGRITRLIQLMASGYSGRAVGLAEDTAVVIDSGGFLEVVGNGHVITLNGESVHYTNYGSVERFNSITVDGIRMSCLSPGARFDISAWRVLPDEDESVSDSTHSEPAPARSWRYNT